MADPTERTGDGRGPAPRVDHLVETVIEGGYCIGCGACVVVAGGALDMTLDAHGKFRAGPTAATAAVAPLASPDTVCPFSDRAINEDDIGHRLYGHRCSRHPELGYVGDCFVGYVSDEASRRHSSSGGIATWILGRLLEERLVDGVAHVVPRAPTATDPRLFHYVISTTVGGLARGARSHYYPVEMSEVLDQIRRVPGRYCLVGVPCFVKAMRLLASVDPVLRERVVFCIALFCGHLKSARFADLLAWQLGIPPGRLRAFDFRIKLPTERANRYGVRAVGEVAGDTIDVTRAAHDLEGRDWGMGFFRYRACDFCDDVVGETADLSLGDAWLPEYFTDWRGTSLVVAREPRLGEIIARGVASGAVVLSTIEPAAVCRSQRANFRHRRDGLQYRLHLEDARGRWRPTKRLPASRNHLDRHERRLFRLRMRISATSDEAFRRAVHTGSLEAFTRRMARAERSYQRLYRRIRRPQPRPNPVVRLLTGGLRRIRGLLRQIGGADAPRTSNGPQGG